MNQDNLLWRDVLDLLKDRMSRPSFETWLKSTTARIESDKWLIIAPNQFTRDWLESRYLSVIEEAIFSITKEVPQVIVVTDTKVIENPHINSRVDHILHQIEFLSSVERENLFSILKERSSKEPRSNRDSTTYLNPNHTFKGFIVGTGNRFAYAAAQSVAEAPGKAYNPLFIHGSIGLGKTHLLHATGNYILEHNPSAKVLYITAEQFTTEFIGSIRDNQSTDFRKKFREADVLLVDDIQFLAGKEQAQEEFFHTFNQLHENNKQIVLSADCPPKEIKGIIERLMARFTWGLITDILPHDRETQEKMIENSNVNDHLSVNIQASSESQVTQTEKGVEKADKVSLLENEVKQIREELTGLHTEVELLKMIFRSK